MLALYIFVIGVLLLSATVRGFWFVARFRLFFASVGVGHVTPMLVQCFLREVKTARLFGPLRACSEKALVQLSSASPDARAVCLYWCASFECDGPS